MLYKECIRILRDQGSTLRTPRQETTSKKKDVNSDQDQIPSKAEKKLTGPEAGPADSTEASSSARISRETSLRNNCVGSTNAWRTEDSQLNPSEEPLEGAFGRGSGEKREKGCAERLKTWASDEENDAIRTKARREALKGNQRFSLDGKFSKRAASETLTNGISKERPDVSGNAEDEEEEGERLDAEYRQEKGKRKGRGEKYPSTTVLTIAEAAQRSEIDEFIKLSGDASMEDDDGEDPSSTVLPINEVEQRGEATENVKLTGDASMEDDNSRRLLKVSEANADRKKKQESPDRQMDITMQSESERSQKEDETLAPERLMDTTMLSESERSQKENEALVEEYKGKTKKLKRLRDNVEVDAELKNAPEIDSLGMTASQKRKEKKQLTREGGVPTSSYRETIAELQRINTENGEQLRRYSDKLERAEVDLQNALEAQKRQEIIDVLQDIRAEYAEQLVEHQNLQARTELDLQKASEASKRLKNFQKAKKKLLSTLKKQWVNIDRKVLVKQVRLMRENYAEYEKRSIGSPGRERLEGQYQHAFTKAMSAIRELDARETDTPYESYDESFADNEEEEKTETR